MKQLLKFEKRHQRVAPPEVFRWRLLRNFLFSQGLVAFSLGVGMIGYHVTERMNWIDAFANASMILSGMGPLGELHNDHSKIFAGCYALYSGLVVVVATGLIVAPVFHRLLHRFHVDE